jgi:hypothetical protein
LIEVLLDLVQWFAGRETPADFIAFDGHAAFGRDAQPHAASADADDLDLAVANEK